MILVAAVVLRALILRTLAIANRRLLDREAQAARAEGEIGDQAPDLGEVDQDTRQLLNLAIGIAVAVGLAYVWLPLLPKPNSEPRRIEKS